MDINATLIAQMIVFILLVWFTMKFIWPVLLQVMEDREKRIADGLAAGEEGRRQLQEAEKQSTNLVEEGRKQSAAILARAQKRHDEIVDEAKQAAKAEGERILLAARKDVDRERSQAQESLREQLARLVLAGAETVLGQQVDAKAHAGFLDKLGSELGASKNVR